MRMSRDVLCFQASDAIDQIDQGGHALRGIPFGIGQSGSKVLLVHRALSDHRVDRVARDHAGKDTASRVARQNRLSRARSGPLQRRLMLGLTWVAEIALQACSESAGPLAAI